MIGQIVRTEVLKLRRSMVPLGTLGAMLAAPWGIALFMWIIRDPARAASLGLLGTKANLAGLEATWPAFGSYLVMLAGPGGLVMLAFIVAYLFGREYADGTARNLLALPVERHWFVVGKLAVAAGWWLVLLAVCLLEGLAIGRAMDLPGGSAQVAVRTVASALACAGAAFLLAPVGALITVWSRSYLAAIAGGFGAVALGDLFVHTGWAEWFPWSVVLLMSQPLAAGLSLVSGLTLALTFVAGVAATAVCLRFADNP